MSRTAGVLALVALCALVVFRAVPAEAHATLVRAEPAANAFLQRPPGEITLVFSEPIDSKNSDVRLLDAAGQEIALDEPVLTENGYAMRAQLPDLGPGIYNVLWSNVSRVDGHQLRGAFPFTVLQPDGSLPDEVNSVGGLETEADPPPLPEGVAVRALSLFGLVIAAGPAVLFLLGAAESARVRRGFAAMMLLGVATLAVGTLLNLQTLREVYSGTGLQTLLFDTHSGAYWLARIGAVLFIGVLTLFIEEAPKRASAAVLFASAIYLWGFTATSHAAAGAGSAWAQGVDVIHGVTAIVWIGAVLGVALMARLTLRDEKYARLMPRFGLLASLMVFTLLATGVVSAFVELDHPERLWTTRYGVTLAIKLALIVPLLAVAFWNSRWGRDRLIARAPGEPRRFVATVTAEAMLGIAVFVVAAVLTQSTVAKGVVRDPGARAFDQAAPANDVAVQLEIDPNRTGINTYTVTLTKDGAPVDAERVRLTFRYQDDQTVGPSNLALQPAGGGTFIGQGPFLTLEGQWRVEVEVRRADVDDAIAFFDVRPAGSAVNAVRRGGAWDNPAPGLSWNQFGGLLAALIGLGFALFKSELWRFGKRVGWAGNSATAASFGVAALLLFGVHSHTPTGDLPSNPIFPDQDSIAIGRDLYQQNCAACHGLNGVPPRGLDLNPYPLDLTVHVPQHPDGQIFLFIQKGVPGSAMPAWGELDEGRLTDEQIWHLVNFLRTLGIVER